MNKKQKKLIKNQITTEQLRIERAEIFKAINILKSQEILTLNESLRCAKRLREKYYNERKELIIVEY